MITIERESYITNDHLSFLDDLRESCAVNMFGARPYLIEEFPELTESQASKVLSYWMKTYSDRNKQN